MPANRIIRWDLVRQVYERCAWMKVSDLEALAGVSETALYRHARKEGWTRAKPEVASGKPARGAAGPMTSAAAAGDGAAGPGDDAAAAGVQSPADRRALLESLWSAVRRHVRDLEAVSRASPEARDMQALMNAVRTVEKLMEMERTAAGERGGCHCDEGPDDIDEFREEIARRLEGLLGARPQ